MLVSRHAFETGNREARLIGNPEHCLSYLLHSAKCNADLTVFPMQWGEKYVYILPHSFVLNQNIKLTIGTEPFYY